jgi:hypothetical protein
VPSKYGGIPVDDDQTKAGGSKYGGVAVGSGSPPKPINMQLAPSAQTVKLQQYQNPNEASMRPMTDEESNVNYAKRVASNVLPSLATNTLGTLTGIVTGPINAIAGAAGANVPSNPINQMTGVPEKGVLDYYTGGFKDNFAADPLRVISDASMVMGLSGATSRLIGKGAGLVPALSDAAETFGSIGNRLNRGADLTNMIAWPTKIVGATPNALYRAGSILGGDVIKDGYDLTQVPGLGKKTAGALDALATKAPPKLSGLLSGAADATESLTDKLSRLLKQPRESIRLNLLPKIWGYGGQDLTPDAQRRLTETIAPGAGIWEDANGNKHMRLFSPQPSYKNGEYGTPNVLSVNEGPDTQINKELGASGDLRQSIVADPAFAREHYTQPVADVILDPQKAEDLIKESRQVNTANRTVATPRNKGMEKIMDETFDPTIAGRDQNNIQSVTSVGRRGVVSSESDQMNAFKKGHLYWDKAGTQDYSDFHNTDFSPTMGYIGAGKDKLVSPLTVREAAGYTVKDGRRIPGFIGGTDKQAADAYDHLRMSGGWDQIADQWDTQARLEISGLAKDQVERVLNLASKPGQQVGTRWRELGLSQSDLIDVQNIIKMELAKGKSTIISHPSGYMTMQKGRVLGSVAAGKIPLVGPLFSLIVEKIMNRPFTSKILANVLSTVPVDSSKLRWVHQLGRGMMEKYNADSQQEQQQPVTPSSPPPNMDNQ